MRAQSQRPYGRLFPGRRRPLATVFDPRSLFRNGEQGVWYAPNDLSTLFQDAAGTTPVTSAGQPVGLMLDKRFGLVRGSELQVNGDFSSVSGWTLESGWSISGGKAVAVSVPTARNVFPTDNVATVAGRWYEITVVVTALTAGTARLFAFNGSTNIGRTAPITAPGTYTARFAATNTTTKVYISAQAGPLSGEFELVSFKELPGNHAFQPTAASHPMLRDTPRRVDYDGVDDALNVTFPSSLGSACTVARSIPGVGAQILTAQTIGTTYTLNVDSCGDLIIDRALTPTETANLTTWLNQRAGV